MTATHHAWLLSIFLRLTILRPKQKPSEWCEANVRFDEPECGGQFSFSGREYLREPVDNWGDDQVKDQVTVFGTRMGKTRILYGGLAWTVAHNSVRALYVKPKSKGTAGAEDDARTRFIPMLRATKPLADLIPDGQRRYEFKTAQQILGGSIVDWTGSNSVSSLASNPCRVVIQDEVDKFNTTRKRDTDGNVVEADASALADERCKEFSTPKRFKASTPTLPGGLIWVELLKSDLRRRFMPCPHCEKEVVFAWSEQFTVLPKLGCEAYVRWDQKAKFENGDWNYELVEATAHAECPHCKGKILDHHKFQMDELGVWRPTQKGAPGYRGYHLPSMYSMHAECNFGRMAVRFLKGCKTLDGPRGFINSDLAEPYAAQDIASKRTALIATHVEITDEWHKLLSIDCQQKAPYFWFTLRAFGQMETVGLKGGSLDSWDDIERVQKENKVLSVGVIIDSGFGAKDDAEVYRNCAQHGELQQDPRTGSWMQLGWMPAKGMPGRRRWRSTETGLSVPYRYQKIDPYMGTSDAGRVGMDLFEFAADFFKDILATLRANRGDINYKFKIASELDTDEYHLHMRGQHKVERVKYGQIVLEWHKRHRYAEDHMFACEVQSIAAANAFGFIDVDNPMNQTEPKQEETPSAK